MFLPIFPKNLVQGIKMALEAFYTEICHHEILVLTQKSMTSKFLNSSLEIKRKAHKSLKNTCTALSLNIACGDTLSCSKSCGAKRTFYLLKVQIPVKGKTKAESNIYKPNSQIQKLLEAIIQSKVCSYDVCSFLHYGSLPLGLWSSIPSKEDFVSSYVELKPLFFSYKLRLQCNLKGGETWRIFEEK